MYTKAFNCLDKTLHTVVFLLTAVLSILIFGQVVLRYGFSKGFAWSEELAVYVFIWDVMLCIAIGVKRHSHIGVEIFSGIFPKAKPVMRYVIALIGMCFWIVLAYYGYQFSVSGMDATSAALRIPLGYVYFSIPTCGVMSTIFILNDLFARPTQKNGGDEPS